MHVLPIIALSTVALGFFGGVDRTDRLFEAQPKPQLTSYAAGAELSVTDMMERAPQSVDQPFCDQSEKVGATLAHDFAEDRKDTWTEGKDMVLQLWGSEIMGTWTLLHVGQDDIACVVSSGTGWSGDSTPADVMAMTDVAGS